MGDYPAECRPGDSNYRCRMIEPCADVFFPLLFWRQWLPWACRQLALGSGERIDSRDDWPPNTA